MKLPRICPICFKEHRNADPWCTDFCRKKATTQRPPQSMVKPTTPIHRKPARQNWKPSS